MQFISHTVKLNCVPCIVATLVPCNHFSISLRKSVIFPFLHRPIAYLLLLQMTCEHLVLYYLILNHCINNRYIFQIKSNDFYFYFIKRLKTNFIFLEWLLKRGCNRSGQLQEIRRNVRKLLLKFL